MPVKRIVTGQDVPPEMLERAKELRKNMTRAESVLWEYLRGGRLDGYHFRRQQVIHRFIVDFYCHRSNFVVELDGGVHLGQMEYDCERDQYLTELGLRVMRFTNTDVNNNLEGVLSMILDACHYSGEEMPGG